MDDSDDKSAGASNATSALGMHAKIMVIAQLLQLVGVGIIVGVHFDGRVAFYQRTDVVTVDALRSSTSGTTCPGLGCLRNESSYCLNGSVGGHIACDDGTPDSFEVMPTVTYTYTQSIATDGNYKSTYNVDALFAEREESSEAAGQNFRPSEWSPDTDYNNDFNEACNNQDSQEFVNSYNKVVMVIPMQAQASGSGAPAAAEVRVAVDYKDADKLMEILTATCLGVGILAMNDTDATESSYAYCVLSDYSSDRAQVVVDITALRTAISKLGLVGGDKSALNTLLNESDTFDPNVQVETLWGKHQFLGKVCQWSRAAMTSPYTTGTVTTTVMAKNVALWRYAHFGSARAEDYKDYVQTKLWGASQKASGTVACKSSLVPEQLPLKYTRFAKEMVIPELPRCGLDETPYGDVVTPLAGCECSALPTPIMWGVEFSQPPPVASGACSHVCSHDGTGVRSFSTTVIVAICLAVVSTLMFMGIRRAEGGAEDGLRGLIKFLKVLLVILCIAASVYIGGQCFYEGTKAYEVHSKCVFEDVKTYITDSDSYTANAPVFITGVAAALVQAACVLYFAGAGLYATLLVMGAASALGGDGDQKTSADNVYEKGVFDNNSFEMLRM